ncbi:MAG: hypothetical protein KDC79_12255 [Cyclobacteriaceae bacterium]|nr:hypothetical protein [Cyclobacteriaceae bacterium]
MKKLFIILLAVTAFSCQEKGTESANEANTESTREIKDYLSQYKPYPMDFDATSYNETDRTILKKLVEASEYLDTIYWLQTSKYGLHLRDSLAAIKDKNQSTKDLLTLVNRNGGPFELLNGYKTFIGNQTYYPGDELYPMA